MFPESLSSIIRLGQKKEAVKQNYLILKIVSNITSIEKSYSLRVGFYIKMLYSNRYAEIKYSEIASGFLIQILKTIL